MSTNAVSVDAASGKGFLIGFLGNSGIGKSYLTRHIMNAGLIPGLIPLPKITTRPPRPGDKEEGVETVSPSEFERRRPGLIGVYDPLGNGMLYGYPVKELKQAFEEGKIVIGGPDYTEEILKELKDIFHDGFMFIGLTSNPIYIEENLRNRAREENPDGITPATEEDIKSRLATLEHYNALAREALQKGFTKYVITVDDDLRPHMVESIVNLIRAEQPGLFIEGRPISMEGMTNRVTTRERCAW